MVLEVAGDLDIGSGGCEGAGESDEDEVFVLGVGGEVYEVRGEVVVEVYRGEFVADLNSEDGQGGC